MFGMTHATFNNYEDLISKYEPMKAIEIRGESKEKDIVLFRAISSYCNASLTKLQLKNMNLRVAIDQIPIFPNLQELELGAGTLSWSFLKLNVWCPNLESLNMDVWFEDDSDDDWQSIAESHASPLVQRLNITMTIDSKEEVYYCFEAMEKQFPMLNSLFLNFNTDFTLNSANSLKSTYQPLYFKNLKTLSIFAFGNCDNIFNYLNISNASVKEIKFNGMNADATLIESLTHYKKVNKLTLVCTYVYEDELNGLCSGLPKLMTLALDTKVLHWNLSDLMEFIKKSPRLRRLRIDVDRENPKFKIDEENKIDFLALIEGGRKFLQLEIIFFQSSLEYHLSRKGILEISSLPNNSDSDSNGWF